MVYENIRKIETIKKVINIYKLFCNKLHPTFWHGKILNSKSKPF